MIRWTCSILYVWRKKKGKFGAQRVGRIFNESEHLGVLDIQNYIVNPAKWEKQGKKKNLAYL